MPKPADKPVIAIDLDEVLSAQMDAIRVFTNKYYGTKLSPDDFRIEAPYWRYFETVWGVDDKEGERRVEHYISSGGFGLQKTLPGALEAIKRLKHHFRLVIITSRKKEHAEMTHQWLEKHFPRVFDHIGFTSVWGSESSVAKAKLSKEIGASYLIDDNLDHCLLAAREGIRCLLFGEYGWNRGNVTGSNIVRVKNWEEVLKYFDEESR
jgi:uncharacterized HAD superfamily protein